MCPLMYKEFMIGYLLAFALLSLLVYAKVILFIPRGLDYGAMALFALCILLSRRMVLGGSLSYRLLILGAGAVLSYLGSIVFFPGQYTLLSEPKDKDALDALLRPGDEMRIGKEKDNPLIVHPPLDRREFIAYLKTEAPRPTFYLVLSLLLVGISLYVYFG